MPHDTKLFTGVYKMPPPPPHSARSYTQTQHRERGKVGVVRERESRRPSTLPRWALDDPPSIHAIANDLGFQELATPIICTGVEARISVNAPIQSSVIWRVQVDPLCPYSRTKWTKWIFSYITMACIFLKFNFVTSCYTKWIKIKFYWSSWIVIIMYYFENLTS